MAKQAPIAAVEVDFPTPPLKLAKVMTLCNIEIQLLLFYKYIHMNVCQLVHIYTCVTVYKGIVK